jgi:hypothetical protein
MVRRIAIPLLFCCLPAASVVIDRIAVIVDKHVIKTSDIDRDTRVTEFLNREPVNTSRDARQKSAERLIEQTVIREEMEKGGYTQSTADEVSGMMRQILTQRFAGSDARMKAELSRYGLTEAQLRLQLQWQLDVLKFMDQRFRPAVLVTDEEVRQYYDQHKAEVERQFPQAKTYAAIEPKVRASMEEQRMNQSFDNWLTAARKRDRIVYHQEAFQ